MTTTTEFVLAREEIDRVISVAHKQGLNYWEILDLFLKAICTLHMKASVEYRLKERG